MFAVCKLNEKRIVLIFLSEKDLCNWATIILVTKSADAQFSTQTATKMAASATNHDSIARFVTSWPVAQLSTQLRTLVMTTFPRAHLRTRHARLATRFVAIAVVAPVFAFSGTG